MLQSQVEKIIKTHKEIIQYHGLYYFEEENRLIFDIVPDETVTDDKEYCRKITNELQALILS